ncbi:MAG: HAD family hydrolase [Phycisphaerales bacterium]|nr:HAD family hydrolase [Phycisphaerales bacterium]
MGGFPSHAAIRQRSVCAWASVMTAVVVFDLDDTLYPESAFVESGFRAVGAHALGAWGIRGLGDACLTAMRAGSRGDTFQRAYERVSGADLPADRAHQLLKVYREHPPDELPWHEDALATVQMLHGHVPVTLLSDGYLPTQANKARALGLERWIEKPVFTEALGREHWKPSTKGFELIMSRYPGTASFVYVGDNPLKDFIAPRALGWRTIHIKRPTGTYAHCEVPPDRNADHQITSLLEIPEKLGITVRQ